MHENSNTNVCFVLEQPLDTPNFNYALNSTAFLGLLLNLKATVVLILFPSTLGYLVIYLMLFFRNTKCL